MVILWALSSFPAPPPGATGPAIQYSIAGHLGAWLAVLFAPIGFNWQISIALVPGLAAREVAVGALGTVYALSATGKDVSGALTPLIAQSWSLPTALSLLAWYVFAPAVPVDAGDGQARDQFLALSADHGRLICSRWPTRPRSSPIGRRSPSRADACQDPSHEPIARRRSGRDRARRERGLCAVFARTEDAAAVVCAALADLARGLRQPASRRHRAPLRSGRRRASRGGCDSWTTQSRAAAESLPAAEPLAHRQALHWRRTRGVLAPRCIGRREHLCLPRRKPNSVV